MNKKLVTKLEKKLEFPVNRRPVSVVRLLGSAELRVHEAAVFAMFAGQASARAQVATRLHLSGRRRIVGRRVV